MIALDQPKVVSDLFVLVRHLSSHHNISSFSQIECLCLLKSTRSQIEFGLIFFLRVVKSINTSEQSDYSSPLYGKPFLENQRSAQSRPPDLSFTFTFNNEKPIQADQLGGFFSDLSLDYERFTHGRTLVIVRLDTGSLIATLKDAIVLVGTYLEDGVEFAKATKAIADFVKLLKRLFASAKDNPGQAKLFARGRKQIGMRSVERLVKIAADSNCEVVLKHALADGEVLDLRITPTEAIAMREREKGLPVHNKRLEPMPAQHDLSFSVPVVQFGNNPQMIAQTLADSYRVGGGIDNTQVQQLVLALASALRSAGLAYLLETIAGTLELKGLHDLATIVRKS